jgi:HSP20 family protein
MREVQPPRCSCRTHARYENEENEDDYYRSERWTGSFSWSLPLPSGVDADGITATLKHGILEIHLPKTKEAAGKTIEVKAA